MPDAQQEKLTTLATLPVICLPLLPENTAAASTCKKGGIMEEHYEELDPSETEALDLLKKALGPPDGDIVVTVESYDHNLIRKLSTLGTASVRVEERVQKAGLDPVTIHLIISVVPKVTAGATILAAPRLAKGYLDALDRSLDILERILTMIKTHSDDKNGKSKTKIRAGKEIVPRLTAKYEASADVTIEEVEDETDAPEGV